MKGESLMGLIGMNVFSAVSMLSPDLNKKIQPISNSVKRSGLPLASQT